MFATVTRQHFQLCSELQDSSVAILSLSLLILVLNDGDFLPQRYTSNTISRTNSEQSAQQQGKPTVALPFGHGFVGLTRLSAVGGIGFGRKSGR
jgi:hypothetical protein